MAKIRVLDENLINKIAAGEVIENPASVVKELVENAIDAGSTEICVEIQGGGRQLIRITDDGCGMQEDDALLSLERHATSKIREIDDIHAIHTMGFRGEAIPSIASISKFTLLTCPRSEDNKSTKGTLIIVDGGKIIKCCEAARSPGTTIEVKSLFFNVPVRKKFQKSPNHDTNEIQKMLSTIALGNPTIKFQLISNLTNVFLTAPVLGDSFEEKLGARIRSILGEDFYGALCPIKTENSWCKIEGWIGQSFYNRHNRSGQYLFINQRPVVSSIISYAVRDGYGSVLATQRHPVFVLHLTLEGTLVDVNVHPQKREVRLRQEQQLRELVAGAVQEAVQGHGVNNFSFGENSEAPFFPSFAPQEKIEAKTSSYVPPFFKFEADQEDLEQTSVKESAPFVESQFIERPFVESKFIERPPVSFAEIPQKAELPLKTVKPLPWDIPKFEIPQEETLSFSFEAPVVPVVPTISVNSVNPITPKAVKFIPRVIGTIPGYLILDETAQSFQKGLSIVDQRAAHARIVFERLQNHSEDSNISQTLLIPYTIEFTPFEAQLLRDNIDDLNRLGLAIHEFGGNTFAIDAIPTFLNDSDILSFVKSIVQQMHDDVRSFKIDKEKQLALAASRAAISTKKQLSIPEAQGLLKQLYECQCPQLCPQGKPTIVRLSTDELAKHFEKVGSP